MNTDDGIHEIRPEIHDEWMELCALATANALTAEERTRLQEHLASCAKCRETYRQYSVLAHEGVPPLAGSYSPKVAASSVDALWDRQAARERLIVKADEIAASADRHPPSKTSKRRALFAAGSGLAAAVVFSLGLGSGYLLNKRIISTTPAAPIASNVADLAAQKASLSLRLNEENTRLADLESEGGAREKEITGLKDQLSAMDTRAAQSAKDKAGEDLALTAAMSERDTLQGKLRDTQANYDQVEQELTNLKAQRQQDQLHYASLEFEVTDLRTKLRDADTRANDASQYLASDRDIRELMGARQLYIADVTDMDANGQQRKPFGRVFYTKGKQLIFYAFDLNQQPGVKQASIFQAWAHEGSDRTHPVSLGIFYIDSEANRRWALKTDDPKVLAQINSVFVTVEPKGGSQKPTTKPLLYAYLKTEAPNHP